MNRAPSLLLAALVAGCAGQLRDYVGPRSSIVRPQLIRFGFSLPQIACVGERLGEVLTPRQLRLFTRQANYLARPYFEPDRFSPRDYLRVARGMADGRIGIEVGRAYGACAVSTEPPAPRIAAAPPAAPAPPPPSWLNLGAAGSGQSIAIDATSIEQDARGRSAWFRMVDPGTGPSLHAYRLRIECAARTIEPLAHRRYEADGRIAESRIYPAGEERPAPIEAGTVTEIAFLSLCT